MTQRKRLTHARRLCSFECYPIEIVAEQTLEALMGRSLGGERSEDQRLGEISHPLVPSRSQLWILVLPRRPPCGGSSPGLDLGKAIHLSVPETRAA